MVEVRMVGSERVESAAGGYTRGDYQLFIDGKSIEKAIVSAGGEATGEGAWFTIHIRDAETFGRVAAFRLREFPQKVCEFVLKFEVPHVEFVRYVHLGADETVDGRPFDFVFSFEPKLDDWKEPYSPMDYYLEFQSMGPIYDSQIEVGLNDREEGLAKGFYIKFPSVSVDEPIAVEYQKCVLGLQQLQGWVSRSLALRRPVDSLVSRFIFRE